MLDILSIRKNPNDIQKAALAKGVSVDIKKVLKLDEEAQGLQKEVQQIREERNTLVRGITGKPSEAQVEKGKKLKEKLEKKEEILQSVTMQLQVLLLNIPNPSKPDVKVGKDDSENDIIRKYKEPTKFSFTPKDHLTLGESLNIIDVERAAKISGSRFAFLKNDAVLLEFALVQFALETLIKEGFTPVIPPVLIKRETMQALGYMENSGEEDMFVTKDDLFLVGTAEQALVPMYRNETFNVKDLPLRYVGFSSAFRREAGSYGKDTKGILRLHQFDKVEMVSFVPKGKDDMEHEYLLSLEEKFYQILNIPYQVVKMCTGDLGYPAARKYDIEAWMPGQNKYREVTSVSTVTDFQSRRLNIRYKDDNETAFVDILNGTAFAIGRTIIAILENYQQEDGSVVIPQVLRKYMGKDILKPQE